MPIRQELLDELLNEYEKPEDLLGDQGILQQLTKALVERGVFRPNPRKVSISIKEFIFTRSNQIVLSGIC